MTADRINAIKELESLAKEILVLKESRDLRRPILIEFCGSPKSGKSTTVNSLNIFLKRNGVKTKVLTERASICPVKNKTHPFFNIWTLCTAVAEIIQHLDEGRDKVDIIISDRGIFDALCWFHWLNTNSSEYAPYLDDVSYKILSDFTLMDIWYGFIDLIYVFQVAPDTSIKREYATLLTDKRGSIMREPVLKGFNQSVNEVMKIYGNKFRKITNIKTDIPEYDNHPNSVSYEVTSNVLNILSELLIEKIGYFEKCEIKPTSIGISPFQSIASLKLKYGPRTRIELTKTNIQPIAIAVITNKIRNKVLVVKKSLKRTASNSPESNTLLLYIGGHVRQEDEKTDDTLSQIIHRTLRREIQEEIGESIAIKNSAPFIIYTPDNPISEKHIAICHVIEMDLKDKVFKLTSDEFMRKSETSKSGHLLSINDILHGNYKLESWSQEILKHVFNRNYVKETNIFYDTIQ